MKPLILKVSVLLIVLAFSFTSFAMVGQHANNVASNINSQTSFRPLNQQNSAGYVKYTLVLSNNTLIKGNFLANGSASAPYAIADAVAYDPSNGYVYVTNQGSNSVSVINGTTNSVIKTVSVGSGPQGVAYDPSNGYVYVTNLGSNSVSVINGANNSVIKTVSVGSYPAGVAFDSSNGYVYVAICGSNSVSVINGTTNSVIKTISVGSEPDAVAYDPSNDYVYVANYGSGTISIISTSSASSNKYAVTFTESGLPSGTSWSLTFNGIMQSSTTSTITFSEPNGSYSYTVGSVSGYTSSTSSGSLTVSGSNISKTITFTPVQVKITNYKVTFTETGLPSGTTWYVNLSNGIDSGAITGTSYSFSLTNGTYSYTTSNVSGYSVMPSSGSISVNGSSISKTITYKATSTPPGKTSPSGISSTEIYGVIGAVIAVAAIGAGITVYRKRR